eukprot:272037_1
MMDILYFLTIISICIFNILSLDVLDYTYYYKTYHYIPNTLSFSTFYNTEIDTNITIDISNNKAILILHNTNNNNIIKLDILNDNNWNEISTIKPYKQYKPNKQIQHRRQLLQGPPMGGRPMMKVYKGFRKPMPFNDAVMHCRKFGALIASVRSPQQNMNAMKTCSAMAHDMVCWIGLKRPFTTWLDSKSVEFANWRKGEPNNEGGDQDCTEIYPNGLWNDENCEKGRAFICQKIQPAMPSRAHIPQKPMGAHPRYGGTPKGKCGACGGKKSCESPCAKLRRARRARQRARRRGNKNRRKRKRVKGKWRKKMRRLRKWKDAKLKRALRKLKRRHQREARTYSFVMNLLDKKIEDMKSTGQIAPFGQDRRRRRIMDQNQFETDVGDFVDRVSRCKVMSGYEICVNYHIGSKFMSVDVRIMNQKAEKPTGGYKNAVVNTKKFFEEGNVNPIEDYMGYVMGKYSLMNGMSDSMDDIYYFDEFEVDLEGWFIGGNNVFVECSEYLDDLPFRMCIKVVEDGNAFLYFEKDVNDVYEVYESYVFQVKEYIDNGFENNVFEFNKDDDWDEIDIISVVNSGLKGVKKCSYKLIIGKVCIEQFDDEHYAANIKLKTEHKKRNGHD